MTVGSSFKFSTRRSTLVAASISCAASLVGLTSHAQSVTSGGFVATLGKDTVAFEQYTRTGNVMTGDYVTVQGGVTASHYVLKFDVNNMPSELTLTQMRGDGSPIPGGPSSVKMTVGANETIVDILKEPPVQRKFAVKVPYPLLGTSIAMFEVAMQRLRTLGNDSVSFAGLPLNAQELPSPIQVKFLGTDSARVWTAGGPMYMRVTKNGEIHGVSARETKTKIEVRRVPVTTFKAMMMRFTK